MLCEDLGRLLVALPRYVNGVFGDDAIVGEIKKGYDGKLLDIRIFIRMNGKSYDMIDDDIGLLEELIYNPCKHNDYLLSQIYIGYDFYE